MKHLRALILTVATCGCIGLLTSGCVTTRTHAKASKPKPYPFEHCAVNRQPFDDDGPLCKRIHDGYEVEFCCLPCVKAFDLNPEPFMPPIREYYAEQEEAAATIDTRAAVFKRE